MGSWITREMYESAEILDGPTQPGTVSGRAVGFVDIGLVHDPTAVAVCHLDGDVVVLDALRTLQGSRSSPVELEAVEDLVRELTKTFSVSHWTFEAPQAVASVQRLQGRIGASVEARYPTADTQARLFGTLYRVFADRRIRLFKHDQLKREALNLVTKTVGGRLKVVDSSAIHQDHVIAVGGAAELLIAGLEDRSGELLVIAQDGSGYLPGSGAFESFPDGLVVYEGGRVRHCDVTHELGALSCSKCDLPFDPTHAERSLGIVRCCGVPHPPGALSCSKCGVPFAGILADRWA